MAEIVLHLTPGTPSELLMKRLHVEQELAPAKIDGLIDWPHARVTTRIAKPTDVEYRIEQVDECQCGKVMHPLPFYCADCLSCHFSR